METTMQKNKLPEGWEMKKVGKVLELVYGAGLTKGNRKEGNVPDYGSNGIVGYHHEPLITHDTIIVKEQVVCPKCRTDISQRKCAVKENYFLMRLVAATISLTMEANGEFVVPRHLK